MKTASDILELIKKDILLEWRQKYALGGIVLYVVATVFVIYMALNQENALGNLDNKIWNILFWITILFASVNAIAKSFTQESRERQLYYYTLVSPQAIILAKMVYNFFLMTLLSLICFGVYALMIGYPVKNFPVFFAALLLGGTGFSFVFTMISAIASKANNSSTLMAILSFPVILPVIVVLLRLARNAYFIEFSSDDAYNSILILAALNVLIMSLAYILFPYLWRD